MGVTEWLRLDGLVGFHDCLLTLTFTINPHTSNITEARPLFNTDYVLSSTYPVLA